jgi:predicted DNA-binding protein with PD1-like motif
MRSRIINQGPPRTFALVFGAGEEVVGGMQEFIQSQDVTAAEFTGLGAMSDVVLGYFDWDRKTYKRIPITEQVEVVSFLGNVALGEDGRPSLHPHVVVAKADGTAHGGHLMQAHIRPILEVVLTESPTYLQRRKDPESGLSLIQL